MFPPYSLASALLVVSCADTRIGGAGGVPVQGVSPGQDALNHGLNKRVLIVPEGYNWASTVPYNQQPVCQVSGGWRNVIFFHIPFRPSPNFLGTKLN